MKEQTAADRRAFLKSAITAGIALATAPHFGCVGGKRKSQTPPTPADPEGPAADAQPPVPPATFKDVRLAFIGTGGIGGYHLEAVQDLSVQCPCFCDVDTTHFSKFAEAFPNARRYQDYREMFDKEQRNFDAVMIGVPDHHHYPATMIALQLGKHTYTQKPLTHTVWEARRLAETARTMKVATQMGNQGHAGEGWRLVYEWIHSGALGDILETHTWTDRPIWPQGVGRPEEEDAVPASLDWDVWLGPAPLRPFKNKVYHPFNWRGWWDFGCGALGDMACHTMDGVFWALDPGYPTAIELLALTVVNDETFPKASVLRWEFPKKGKRHAFRAYWYDGGLMPPVPDRLEAGRKMPSTGSLFLGTKAAMIVGGDYGESPRIFPESRMREIGKPRRLLERSPGHVLEWIMAVAGEKPLEYARSNFSYSGPFTEAVLLGNVALRAGRRLEWDGAKMTFKNRPEANQYLTKEYRAGWKF